MGIRVERDFDLQPPANGACAGHPTEWWFPLKAPRRAEWINIRTARQICESCDVRVECLEYAIEAEEVHGIWGAMTPEQRKTETRRRRAAGLMGKKRYVINF
jgi:WhiB family redox-sensing transcriptional regulator